MGLAHGCSQSLFRFDVGGDVVKRIGVASPPGAAPSPAPIDHELEGRHHQQNPACVALAPGNSVQIHVSPSHTASHQTHNIYMLVIVSLLGMPCWRWRRQPIRLTTSPSTSNRNMSHVLLTVTPLRPALRRRHRYQTDI